MIAHRQTVRYIEYWCVSHKTQLTAVNITSEFSGTVRVRARTETPICALRYVRVFYLFTYCFCGVVYVCVRAFRELLSWEKRTRCAIRFPNLIQEICKSSANYCCLFLFSPPFSSLKLVFWGNRSQMENIRCNHFHLLALLLSLRGDTLSPSDISSQWTVTENSSITWDEELWHPESGRNLVIW